MTGDATPVPSASSDKRMAAHAPRILIVGAHALVSSSLAVSLRHYGFSRVSAVAPHEFDPVGGNGSLVPVAGDIALVGLLGGDGRTTSALVEALSQRGFRVLVIASEQDASRDEEYLRCGAEAVVNDAFSIDELGFVLRGLVCGDAPTPTADRAAVLEAAHQREAADVALHGRFDALTAREADVLANLVAGAAPKQIAQAKGISLFTVRGHIHRVLSKLNVNSQREALAMARHAGWPQFQY